MTGGIETVDIMEKQVESMADCSLVWKTQCWMQHEQADKHCSLTKTNSTFFLGQLAYSLTNHRQTTFFQHQEYKSPNYFICGILSRQSQYTIHSTDALTKGTYHILHM